jgi:hypothetical protein
MIRLQVTIYSEVANLLVTEHPPECIGVRRRG